VNYAEIADAYERIEATSKRLEMTDLLVALLKATPKNMLDKVVYLTQGKKVKLKGIYKLAGT